MVNDDLPEAPAKWLCHGCGRVSDQYLTAPNPFDPTDTITGCPHCKMVGEMVGACQWPGCSKPMSGGTPRGHGFRYFCSCWDHSPINAWCPAWPEDG